MTKLSVLAALVLLSSPAFAGVNGCDNGNPPNCDGGGGTVNSGGAGGDATATGGDATATGGNAAADASADAAASATSGAEAVATSSSGGNTLSNSASGNDTSVSVQGDVYREAAQAVNVVVATACGAGFGGSDRNMTVNFAKGQSSFCKNLVLYELLKDSDPERAAEALDRAYQVAAMDGNMTIIRQVLTLGLLGE